MDEELALDVADSVASYFLRNLRNRKQFPTGMYYCYKYHVFGASSILLLFERSTVQLTLGKFFVTDVARPRT